jgi:prevent-host-death family protein
MEWSIATAKSKLSAVLAIAAAEGVQTITRHGKPVGYVLSPEEYQRVVSGKSFKEHLQSGHLHQLPLSRRADSARSLPWEQED